MTMFLVVVVVALVVAGVVAVSRARTTAAREEYERRATNDPLDAELAEVFHRDDPSDDWRSALVAENAVRAATPTIRQRTRDIGQTPLLITHQTTDNHVWAEGGLLVVTTAEVLLFGDRRMYAFAHRGGTSTSITASPEGRNAAVEIRGDDGSVRMSCSGLQQARLICSAIDLWVDDPEVAHDPRVRVTARRVHIPDVFFADVLRTAGHPVTATNMRSVHEKFGMMFAIKARKVIDARQGEAAGERFTATYGRPDDDRELPGWPARVIEGWIAVEPEVAFTTGPFLPGNVRHLLLESAHTGGYLSQPSRPLGMWRSERYEDDGRGARRPGQRPLPA